MGGGGRGRQGCPSPPRSLRRSACRSAAPSPALVTAASAEGTEILRLKVAPVPLFQVSQLQPVRVCASIADV